MALGPLTQRVDSNGNNIFARPPSGYVLARALAANTAESFAVPAGAKFVVLSSTADFYVNCAGTATVPGDTTDGTASELNPSTLDVSGVATISVISAGTPIVTAAFYS